MIEPHTPDALRDRQQVASSLFDRMLACGVRDEAIEMLTAALTASRAEEAARWKAKAREVLRAFDDLFSGGPDTSCRTTWHGGGDGRIECVEVPMADLRETFDRARAVLDGER